MTSDKTGSDHGRVRRALGGAARRTGLARVVKQSALARRTGLWNSNRADADEIQAAIEWAQIAMADRDWPQAIKRWHELLLRYGPSGSSRIYTGLANAYIRSGQPSTAAAVIERGRTLFPNSLDLPLLRAHVASVEEDWEESIRRYRHILDTAGPDASWRIHKGLVAAYLEFNDPRSASEAAEVGLRSFPDNVDVVGAWARIPLKAEHWDEAIVRWQKVVDQFGSEAPWRAYANLSLSHGKAGNLDAALDAIDRGRALYPGEARLAAHAAEIAMARRDWVAAVRLWQELVELRTRTRPAPPRGEVLPRRALVWDWHEEAWERIVQDWNHIETQLSLDPSPLFYRSLARTLKQARLPEGALSILERGFVEYPSDSWLQFDLAVTRLENRAIGGEGASIQGIVQRSEKDHLADRFVSSILDHRNRRTEEQAARLGDTAISAVRTISRNSQILAQFHPSLEPASENLGQVHVVHVPAGSSIELQLKAGRYFSPSAIEERVAKVSHRDGWTDVTSSANPLVERARSTADAFGSRFEDPPFLTADAYSDAAMTLFYEELAVYEPMRRIASDIAAEIDESPVYIETLVDDYRYLDSFPGSRFDVLYLYFELRRRGVNALLCRLAPSQLPPTKPLRFVPGATALVPPENQRDKSTATDGHRAVFPAGIRSVRRVREALGDPVVFETGSIVKEFAYDRSIRQRFPVSHHASIHPTMSTLPELEFAVVPTAMLEGFPLIPELGLDVGARIETSEPIGNDWLFWMDHVLHDYLVAISKQAAAEVSARGITEAHVSDYMYPDASLAAYAVKRTGGRVVLWPHSANPAHVSARRAESFDEVHAITRTGCDLWRKHFPGADVKHTPSVMVDPAIRNTQIDPELPLSLVIIGGRTILRYWPELDQGRHEAAYRDFFQGLAELRKQHPIDVFFKPRGLTGEHEFWLARTVGATADWQRILEHPLRIDIPNPLFVSISMGSSALIEGLGRGIPGLIVRDFPVRDYTTLDETALPIGTTQAMLEVIESLFEPGGYERLLETELEHYASEVQVVDSD